MEDRIPPQSVVTEQALLGAILIEGGIAPLALSLLKPEDFYRKAHALIFQAIGDIVKVNGYPDELTVREKLVQNRALEQVGGGDYLRTLLNAVPSAVNLERYAEIVSDYAQRRNLIALATTLLSEAEGSEAPAEVRARHEQRLKKLDAVGSRWVTLHDVLERIVDVDYAEEFFATGLVDMDYATRGLYQGINVIVAPPGEGKTTLGLQLSVRAAQSGHTVGIFSGDQSVEKLARKMWSHHAGVQKEVLTKQSEWVQKYMELGAMPIEFFEGPMDGMKLLSTMRMRAATGMKWFLIDYLGLVHMPGSAPKHEKKETFTDLLRGLASELGLWVILIAKCIKPGEGPPKLHWLEGAAGVGNAPDQVWWLEQKTDRTTIHVLKAREAKKGKVDVDFQGAINRYRNWRG